MFINCCCLGSLATEMQCFRVFVDHNCETFWGQLHNYWGVLSSSEDILSEDSPTTTQDIFTARLSQKSSQNQFILVAHLSGFNNLWQPAVHKWQLTMTMTPRWRHFWRRWARPLQLALSLTTDLPISMECNDRVMPKINRPFICYDMTLLYLLNYTGLCRIL